MNYIGIENIGEFYSYHYLDSLLDKDLKGLFEQWQSEDEGKMAPDRRLNQAANPFFVDKREALESRTPQERYQVSHRFNVKLLEALGYRYEQQLRYLNDNTPLPLLGVVKRNGQDYLWLVETSFVKKEDESPLEQRVAVWQYSKSAETSAKVLLDQVSPVDPWEKLIPRIFASTEPPRWLILLGGQTVYLFDRTKFGQGKHLRFELDELFGRRERETMRAMAALLAYESLCPADSVPLHDTLDENSHKHAYAVSTDLKAGVIEAVQLLANEYVWYIRNVRKEKLFGDEALADKLTAECLTYLYRLLFVFYVEARGSELNVVPMKSEAYRLGYSLEALRDLEQVPLLTQAAQEGYFLHHSLSQLFQLMQQGHEPEQRRLAPTDDDPYHDYDFTMTGLKAPLFDPNATPMLSKMRVRNLVWQQIIRRLSLSQENRKTGRGRISYAQLGINQLGSVYEGLLSYSGFFAQEEMYEVKPAGVSQDDASAQRYFVPLSEAERYEPDEFVYETGADGLRRKLIHPAGSFIYRLAGRDREKSASYYTPEVLTQCVVKYSLKELLPGKSADEILQLTICEPAMGSGAFINEAINQLAEAYLARKQAELGQSIAPDDYAYEKQKVKAYLALHNAYGVDLKPLAARLAQISLWLNTIHEGQRAPWFEARLAVGNSLIGARRQVYTVKQVTSGEYQNCAPTAIPLSESRPPETIYHWLLPDAGMAAFDTDAVIRELAPDAVQAIKSWRKGFTAKISAAEAKNLVALSQRIDLLWARQVQDRRTLLEQTSEPLDLWGQPQHRVIDDWGDVSSHRLHGLHGLEKDKEEKEKEKSVTSEQSVAKKSVSSDKSVVNNSSYYMSIAEKQGAWARVMNRPTGPYRRLKLAMDYWCALWFWPIPQAGQLPSRQQFWNDLADIFMGVETEFEKPPEQLNLFAPAPEPKQAHFADMTAADVEELCRRNPRLQLVTKLAERHTFHHWELAFAELFAGRGGFDLIVGNPPWVSVSFDEKGLLSEYDPTLVIRKVSASNIAKQRNQKLNNHVRELEYLNEFTEITGAIDFLNALQNYPLLLGMRINLYKCFITKSWEIGNETGFIGLLHPDSVFNDAKGGLVRENIYTRLKYVYSFSNVLLLFQEIMHWINYCVCVYVAKSGKNPNFLYMANVFHPHTIDSSISHDGLGKIPGIKNDSENWDLRGHFNRLIHFDENLLGLFAELYDEEGTLFGQARLPVVHTKEVVKVMNKFKMQSNKLIDIQSEFMFTAMWNETNAQKDGIIKRAICYPNSSFEWIISGPHVYVATPFFKSPNENCRNPLDYSKIDLTTITDDYLPRTTYTPVDATHYLEQTVKWHDKPVTSYYRQCFRAMLAPESERTLTGCIIPKGAGHINGINSYVFSNETLLVNFSGLCNSIIYDFFVRSTGKMNLGEIPKRLPLPDLSDTMRRWLHARTLRLNCLTTHYAELWAELYDPAFNQDGWAKSDPRLTSWGSLSPTWQRQVALRTPFERRQALVEIDVLAALALDLTLEELLTIYRVQFPVLQKNERRLRFDQRGLEVPMKTTASELQPDSSHPDYAALVKPFTPVSREADYRLAWGYFRDRL